MTQVTTRARRESWWRRMSRRMDRASLSFSEQVRDTVLLRRDLDDAFYDDLTELLLAADCGHLLTDRLVNSLREQVKQQRLGSVAQALDFLKTEMIATLEKRDRSLDLDHKPVIMLFVGVNGSGKTTTIGKVAHLLRSEGRTPLIAAADTFRAAAVEQIREWAKRSSTEVVAHQPGADAGAVVFDALQAAAARDVDVVLIDTAGRLHTKTNLMAELSKINRILRRHDPQAPHESLLVIEAPTGMNAVNQAKAFSEALKISGIVLTKLDGSARGGTLLSIEEELNLPVKLVGLGEGIDDLNAFDGRAYVETLFAGIGPEPAPRE